MSINEIIIWLMAIFMVIGAIDRILGNRFGLGEEFENGFNALGPLGLAMVGVISLAPVLASVLRPIIVPVYQFLGADPAMFATTLLANDMGGYPLAKQLAIDPEAGLYAGIILGAMMGPTIVFSIPVALGLIPAEDRKYLALGMLAGFITIPLGCIAGGFTAGWGADVVLGNLVPVVLVSVLIALGLWRFPDKMTTGFQYFGKGVVIMITIGLAAIVWETLTGVVIIPGMAPVWDGIQIIGSIGIVLLGAFPMVKVITKVFKKPLMALGRRMGMNDIAAAGMVATLANNIPMFAMMKDMDVRGKVLNSAFAVSAAFTFGDHLGFTAGVERDLIFPMIVGKLTAGITAVLVAMLVAPKSEK
ncbi:MULTISPECIES: ethanolamine utilization protein EutH [Anaerolinea]|uniref:Ethanolamine utilization protein EutH n=1 Tax=Anaerolinea thermophila (strain DSM 14523 / JCM 11388 / NBRC 100420 / UNI-1) TaxID=926569 RepID=E8N2E4_ANATU|nr:MULTISPECIES: ethanolamine utilization protein EutH [Anaerolinea]BAJ62750.1 ethanolamine utilization protein EutH [Anaerolinea thermophila UNI-1]